jgi:predicted PolB exonuclease-like 3'-5' exonuclease
MVPRDKIKYLIFDVESIADLELLSASRYPGENLTPHDAMLKFQQELLQKSGSEFIPHTYHVPVAVVIAKVREDLSLAELVSLDQPNFRPHVITKHFWTGWEAYQRPTFVTFNGRGFDLPLMELAAYRYGVSVPAWFNIFEKAYQQNRNRYNLNSHIDLHEVLTNFGSTWFRGGLNLAAMLINKPGKMNVQGDMVQQLYNAGRLGEISEYCRCDVLDTYFVFLRVALLMGLIDLDRESELIAETKSMLESQIDEHPAYKLYLDHWKEWSNPW